MFEVLVYAVVIVAFAWAIIEILAAERSVVYKAAWIALIVLLPVFGLVVYFTTADR